MILLGLTVVWLLTWGVARVAYHRGHLTSPWHHDVAALGLLALATLGFFWRVVTGQNWMPADGGDLVSFLYPTYRFAATTLRNGAWPLWNPYLYVGAPHVADIQAGFLYPPNLMLFLLWPDFPYAALQGLSIGHIWFAGAGMYLLLGRGLRLGRIAALAGALAFMFSDVFIVHFGNLNLNAVASWLPWVFWAYLRGLQAGRLSLIADRLSPIAERLSLIAYRLSPIAERLSFIADRRSQIADRRSKTTNGDMRYAICDTRYAIRTTHHAALPGALLGIATLAGHIQATLFLVLALVLYTALWLWLERAEDHRGRRTFYSLAYLSVCLLIAGLIAAPILLPALELAGNTARVSWNYTETAGYSLSPAQWIGWLIPGFFGRGPQFHWGAWPRVEVGYLGILPLILAGLALALRRDRTMWAWAGLAAISLVLALGIYAIPHGWLTLLPGFGQLRAPARFVLLTDFALATLAAQGLAATLQPLTKTQAAAFERGWRLTAYATGAVLAFGVPLAYVTLLLTQDRDPMIVLRTSITLIAVVTFAGLLAASLLWLSARRGEWARPTTLGWLAAGLIFLDVASLGAYQDLGERDPSQGFRQEPIAAFLASQPGPYRIDTRTGIEGLWQPDTALLYRLEDVGGVANPLALTATTRYWDGLGSRSSRLYDLLNVRYVVAKKDVQLDWNKFTLVFAGDSRLNVYENRLALPRAFVVDQVQLAGDREAAWKAIHAAGFDPTTVAVIEGGAPATGGRGQISNLTASPNRLTFQATADGPILVFVSQVWYPGWQVRVDGREQGPPLRADYLFQAVALDAGAHHVELYFAPRLWAVGWALAAAGLALVLLSLVPGRFRPKEADS